MKQGYQNLIGHLKSNHPDYLETFYQAQQLPSNSKGFNEVVVTRSTTQTHSIDANPTNIFKWLQWIVREELDLIFCEKQLTRKNTTLAQISKKTLKKYMFRLVRAVEKIITTTVNETLKFALVFDGWSGDETHFTGLFVTCPGSKFTAEPLVFLLAFNELFDETHFKATNHTEFIRATLDMYNLNEERLICMIGDNLPTNKLVADLMSVPLVGCRSHRLNLAIEDYINEHLGEECEKVENLLSKLSTLNESKHLHLAMRPVKRNATRLVVVADMFKRLEHHMTKLQTACSEVAEFMPTDLQFITIRQHKKTLDDFKSITQKLQNRDTTISDTHVLFQSLIIEFPNFDFDQYLGINAQIIHSPVFETAIIKIQNCDQNGMSSEETFAVKGLKTQIVTDPLLDNDDDLTFAERALKRKKSNTVSCKDYVNTNFVLPTSNDVERFFSKCKRELSFKRRTSGRQSLKALMFLKFNRDLWNLELVHDIVNAKKDENEDEDDDSSDYDDNE